ncbi:Conserved_hypothetical protein [Hexamita inflata]|uniref:Transmembrane protein n=1 Tax=Hexamita inflata TaxID=28002 RepID=A0ABP1HVA9_9EUKA
MLIFILSINEEVRNQCFALNATLIGVQQKTSLNLTLSPIQDSNQCIQLNASQARITIKFDCQPLVVQFRRINFNISKDISTTAKLTVTQFNQIKECSAAYYNIVFGNSTVNTTMSGSISRLAIQILDITQCWSKVVFNYSFSVDQQFFNISVTPQNCEIDSGAVAFLDYDNGDQIFESLQIMPSLLPNHYQSTYDFANTLYFYSSKDMYQYEYDFENFVNRFKQNRTINMKLKLVSSIYSGELAYYGQINNIDGFDSEKIGRLLLKQSDSQSVLVLNITAFEQSLPSEAKYIQFDLVQLQNKQWSKMRQAITVSPFQMRQIYDVAQVKAGERLIFPKFTGYNFLAYITVFNANNDSLKEWTRNGRVRKQNILDGSMKLYKNKICVQMVVTTQYKEEDDYDNKNKSLKDGNEQKKNLSSTLTMAVQNQNQITTYCGRQANFDFKKYQLFQNYFLYQFQLYINSMFSSVSFLFYYFFQPFGHRVNQMIDDIQRDLLQRPLYFFIQQVICGTFFRGNV